MMMPAWPPMLKGKNALSVLVAVSQAAELLLASRVPDIELDGAQVGVEDHGMHLYTQSGDVLLFELSGQMALDESGLADSTIAHKHELELRNLLGSLSFNHL